MKITGRLFLVVALCAVLTPVTFGDPASNPSYLVLVGTYTDKTTSKGIYAFDFDPSTGQLTPRGLAAASANPSWVILHPNGKFAYAANESGKQSMISAFSIDSKSARLTLLNQLPAQGEDPCHLAFDETGKYLFAANYTSGNVTVFPILGEAVLAISQEWSSGHDYATRVRNIRGERNPLFDQRRNGDFFLKPGTTVLDDGEQDQLVGGEGQDWFVIGPFDTTDAGPGEMVN